MTTAPPGLPLEMLGDTEQKEALAVQCFHLCSRSFVQTFSHYDIPAIHCNVITTKTGSLQGELLTQGACRNLKGFNMSGFMEIILPFTMASREG